MAIPEWIDVETGLLSEMVETVGVGVAIYDDSGRYQYVNDAYAAIVETDRSALVGTAIWDVVSEFEKNLFDGYWDSFSEGETRLAEAIHVSDDVEVPVETVTTRRRINGTSYNFGTIRDITERKRRERELTEKNERLKAFTGIVSHDLRNPLSVAKGYLELLQTDSDRDELDLIESALERMDILIEDLLTLAREGRKINDPEEVAVADVATAAFQQINAPNATLEVVCDLRVVADRTRLQQLFENLFRNATEHVRPSVTIQVGTLTDDIGFYVADDGSGIPPEKREKIFNPTYSTGEDGTGFGLAIIKEITAAHGWSITVTESASGGARFEFRGTDSHSGP